MKYNNKISPFCQNLSISSIVTQPSAAHLISRFEKNIQLPATPLFYFLSDTNSCEISELLGSVCLQTVNHQTATQTGSKSPSNRSGSRDSKENESKSPKEPENRFTKEDKPCTDVIGNCEMNGSNKLTDADLVKKLRDKFHLNVPYTDLSPLSWDDLPHELDPARGIVLLKLVFTRQLQVAAMSQLLTQQ